MGETGRLQNLADQMGRLWATWRRAATEASPRLRLVIGLLLFLCAYRLGLPVLYSAALAALPWLLLPRD